MPCFLLLNYTDMSLGDFHVVNENSVSKPNRYQVKADATIYAGEMVILGTGGDVEYVTTIANGAADTADWVGVASTTSTATATADGEVYVWDDIASMVIRGKASAPANLAITSILTKVTFDVSSSIQTLDENDTSSGVAQILDYDRSSSSPAWVDFRLDVGDSIRA